MFSVYLLTSRILEFFCVVILMDFFIELILFVFLLWQDEYSKEDGLSLRNLTLLFCYLCIFGVISRFVIRMEQHNMF